MVRQNCIDGLLTTGKVASPNHPDNYPHNLDKTQTIEVESGKVLRLEFTHFDVATCYDVNTCPCDFVKIVDGDGTTLMDKSCGHSSRNPSDSDYFLPPIITTRSNRVEILFHTDGSETWTGLSWSLSWSAVTPGEKALLMLNSIALNMLFSSPHVKSQCSQYFTDFLNPIYIKLASSFSYDSHSFSFILLIDPF